MTRLRILEKFFISIILLSALPSFIAMLVGFLIYKNYFNKINGILNGTAVLETEIFQGFWGTMGVVLFCIWLITVISAMLVMLLFFKRVLKPLEDLSIIATNIAGGNLSQRIPHMNNGDEISRLYNALRSMNESLYEDIKKLKQVNKLKSEFLSIASHQLRTPLSSIKWLIELLMETNKLDKDQKEKLQDIYKSNERLIELVNDLLNATKLETGDFAVKRQPLNLAELLSGCINSLRPVADSHNQKINFIVETDIQTIKADLLLLNQALTNILDNALAYSPYGSDVSVTLKRDDSHYIVAIHNFGSPILESDHDKLFTKFYRGATAARLRPAGSGLGLFISKMAIESNGGSIWFESPAKDGEGTTFYISFPTNS
ncbi:MAG: hypothetical protein A3I24_00770 [Candidatus Harrisonbacteria bacterium RIFCSPLOWO2_02_FULL_41_13b]|uniref:histidine kinase n=1 Tax=Candidatus Harrisonbacteria bacterium RIFCSPLOWO2_02_FULL_41_13b TaxID=1798409 RepID=A0A1G1ZU96_9BACT|nr:MAG: hypothetical protein A3J53_00020 [Candidatus Harrisonbacteria bacterium RIFCSPHIGHO2_02_FULL_40_20]OGY68152.1 MAG: hypothetical protein A3I24_00770 [Candidatus Harrisonbacteria bacterium RIFCSPLOWO2_02_FULL_41_13b]